MSLVTMRSLLRHAAEHHYAVGYFEAWNLESVLGVIDAAEQVDSPVIIGFSGMFLGNEQRKVRENIYHYGSLTRAIASRARVPAAVLLNESRRMDLLIQGLQAGFNAIMYQDQSNTLPEMIDINQYLVKTAHFVGADVEAELGQLPTSDISTRTLSPGLNTDPDQAAYFAEKTGIDALAIAAGNVHLLEDHKADLDLDLIKVLIRKTHVPLVLHGGTGISTESLREAIGLGISKINVGTILKRIFINSIQNYLKDNNVERTDPHEIVGKGGSVDMLCQARSAISEQVIQFIKVFGSENMARIW